MNNNAKNKTKMIVGVGVMAAIIAVLSQITIPLPTHVPVTLQTFAVALAGYFLGWQGGAAAALVYALLGAVGVPVFAGWSGGFGVITGYTGGFIYGFIVMAFLCGLGAKFCSNKISGKVIAIALGIAGLACDHLLGAIQYAAIADISLGKSILLVSVPYLVKDIISVVAAYLISIEIVSRLAKTGCYAYKRA
ncbi:biotin transporter BioY [Ruminococcus sp.]|uniref:biotin transporter BioY n=1 Tax=Ruminococcus sp. TaxID=41978 RepID=UPI0025DD2606|nr:biotin transporter BioY [Ruminococcus sp.]